MIYIAIRTPQWVFDKSERIRLFEDVRRDSVSREDRAIGMIAPSGG